MQAIHSSFISHIGYEPRTQTVIVTFTRGGVYTYKNVNAKTYAAWLKSNSKGSFYATKIKTHYAAVRVA